MGLVPAASGSAYFELEAPNTDRTLLPAISTLKLVCAVHGPKPVSRNSPFSSNLQLTASVKFAPFAARQRRGYLRDAGERDLGSRLESALKGTVILDRWPKSAIDVIVTILEAEEDEWSGRQGQHGTRGVPGMDMMNTLAGCITAASAALAHARIDCLDLLAGGVMAVIRETNGSLTKALDPCPIEHEDIVSACVVGYLPTRKEVTEVWIKGDLAASSMDGLSTVDEVMESASLAARASYLVLQEAVRESAEQLIVKSQEFTQSVTKAQAPNDTEMKT